jgi:hypothetical protein
MGETPQSEPTMYEYECTVVVTVEQSFVVNAYHSALVWTLSAPEETAEVVRAAVENMGSASDVEVTFIALRQRRLPTPRAGRARAARTPPIPEPAGSSRRL